MSNQPKISRRKLGTLALASIVCSTHSASAKNENALAKEKPLAIHHAKLGNYEVISILDGMVPIKRKFFSGDDEKIDSILESTGQAGDTVPAPISAFLLISDKEKILIDAGMGGIESMGPGFGNLSPGLASVGITPEDISKVILTHAHPDHIGGLLTLDNKKAFPKAELIVAEKEAKFWTDEAAMAKSPKGMHSIFKRAIQTFNTYEDQLSKVADGKEVAKGVEWQLAVGHTPGHSVLKIDGGDKEAVMIADLLHNAELFTALPETGFGFDVDSKQAAVTRKKLFDQLATDKSLVIGSHLPFPGMGRILNSGRVYRYSAASAV